MVEIARPAASVSAQDDRVDVEAKDAGGLSQPQSQPCPSASSDMYTIAVSPAEMLELQQLLALRGRVLVFLTRAELLQLRMQRALQSQQQQQRTVVVATPPAPRLVCVEENPGPVKGQSTASGDMAAAASSSGVPRELGPAPLPAPFSQRTSHQKQYAGLSAFVNENKAELGLMKYLPFTSPGKPADARMAPSDLVPGTLGLFPTRTSIKPRAKVASYPGVLMFMELHEKFNKEWHVPTALRVPVLDYHVGRDEAAAMGLDEEACEADDKWLVRMVLVGDPRAAGPVINSPFNVPGATANCKLSTCLAKDLHLFLRKRTDAQGRLEVLGDFAGASRLSCRIPFDNLDTELLLSYDADDAQSADSDEEGFWSSMRSDAEFNQHCDQCFGKVQRPNNPLFLCSHKTPGGAECCVGRHARCFDSVDGFLFRHVNWYCPEHDSGASIPVVTPAMLRSRSPPRRSIAAKPAVNSHPSTASATVARRLPSAGTGNQSVPQVSSSMLRAPSPPRGSQSRGASFPSLASGAAAAVSASPAAVTVPLRSTLKAAVPLRRRNAWDSDDDEDFNGTQASSMFEAMSGSDGSDRSDSDGSESDSSDELVRQGRPSGLGRRVNSVAPLRIAKLARSATLLSEVGKNEVRQVWLRFQSDHKNSRGTRWACPEPGSSAETKKMQRLCDELAQLHKCCASVSTLLERRQGEQPAFTSHAAMLRSRLQHHKDHNFNSKSMYASFRRARESRAGFFWEGYALCDTCYVAVVGVSRDTMYRNTGQTTALKGARRENLFSKVDEVARCLTQMAISDGQCLPTGEGAQGTSHYVLPFSTADSCRLQLQLQVQAQQGTTCVITPSTFRRAIALMRARMNISINIRKQKKLARCATCEQHSNDITLARLKKNATEMQLAQRLFDEHTDEWREQRQFFEERKQAALRCPWDLNVLTLDGMDTQKTSLPHYHRLTKGEGVENTLPLRVTGGFYIGGAVPWHWHHQFRRRACERRRCGCHGHSNNDQHQL